MKKYEHHVNFGPRVGRHGWGGPNIGKQAILRTLDPGKIVPQPILRTLDPGNTGNTGTGGRRVGCVGQPRRRRARPSLVFSRDGSRTTRLRRHLKRLGAGVGEKRGREARDEAGCVRGAAGRRGEDRRAPSPVAMRPARGRGPGSGFGVSVFFLPRTGHGG